MKGIIVALALLVSASTYAQAEENCQVKIKFGDYSFILLGTLNKSFTVESVDACIAKTKEVMASEESKKYDYIIKGSFKYVDEANRVIISGLVRP